MKKIKVLIMILSLFLLSGCKEIKTPLTGEQFVNKIEKNNYTVNEVFDKPDYAESAYVVSKNFYLYFIEGKKKYDIEGLFIDECKNVLALAHEGYKSKTYGGKNWAKLTVADDKSFYYVIWVGKTYIYAKANIDNRSYVEKLMNSIGY